MSTILTLLLNGGLILWGPLILFVHTARYHTGSRTMLFFIIFTLFIKLFLLRLGWLLLRSTRGDVGVRNSRTSLPFSHATFVGREKTALTTSLGSVALLRRLITLLITSWAPTCKTILTTPSTFYVSPFRSRKKTLGHRGYHHHRS